MHGERTSDNEREREREREKQYDCLSAEKQNALNILKNFRPGGPGKTWESTHMCFTCKYGKF